MQPRDVYLNAIASGKLQNDPAQNDAITELQRCYSDITHKRWFLSRKKIKGVYLWGSVGIGKSMLINMLYECLGPDISYRGHYHEWMANIQKEIHLLSGTKDPIKQCAKNWAKKYRAIILDEFLVTNVADAMIMVIWLQELIHNRITLITTSNTAPQNLYRNGIGREKFLPAIDLIEENNVVLNLKGECDYRETSPTITSGFITPIDNNTDSKLRDMFHNASHGISLGHATINISNRKIKVIDCSLNTLWIEFIDLCNIPRSQLDYIEIAQKYKTIIISNIRKIKASEHNLAANLIKAIDIFYDSERTIIASSDCSPDEVYPEGRHAKAFLRTASRLKSL